MQNPFPVHHSPHVCNKKMKHTSHAIDWTTGFGLGLVVFWSRSHNRFLISV